MEEDLDEIGRFQAERLIEEMIKLVGPFAYNQAIGDARKLVSEKLTNMEEDLYVLEKNEGNKKEPMGSFYFSSYVPYIHVLFLSHYQLYL